MSDKRQTETNDKRQTEANGKRQTASKRWEPPRGISLIPFPNRPQPYGVQWRVDGRRKTKTFSTIEKQLSFAQALAGGVKASGTAAFHLDPDEARTWRAFRADIGPDVDLEAVKACWRRYGAQRQALTVRDAVAQFLAAKDASGLERAAASHYAVALARLTAKMGNTDVAAVDREEVAAWVSGLGMSAWSARTHSKRARELFGWLKRSRLITDNPCDGLEPTRVIQKEAEILSVDQGRALFTENLHQSPELLGRLALEAFAGLRFGSAATIQPADIAWDQRGIALPADRIKTRKRVFITRLPDNLWAWLGRSFIAGPWKMTPRQYLEAKGEAFAVAKIPHPRNCLRHSAATYLVARDGEVGKAATMLCNSEKMIRQHYLGRASEADGAAWFRISP